MTCVFRVFVGQVWGFFWMEKGSSSYNQLPWWKEFSTGWLECIGAFYKELIFSGGASAYQYNIFVICGPWRDLCKVQLFIVADVDLVLYYFGVAWQGCTTYTYWFCKWPCWCVVIHVVYIYRNLFLNATRPKHQPTFLIAPGMLKIHVLLMFWKFW